MKVTTTKPEQWSGKITIEFDSKLEAEVFFSIFNSVAVVTAISKKIGTVYFPFEEIYEKASELGCRNNTYIITKGDLQ